MLKPRRTHVPPAPPPGTSHDVRDYPAALLLAASGKVYAFRDGVPVDVLDGKSTARLMVALPDPDLSIGGAQ